MIEIAANLAGHSVFESHFPAGALREIGGEQCFLHGSGQFEIGDFVFNCLL